MNHPDVNEGGDVSRPPAANLHATHVPPRVCLRQVAHGYREHLLDLVVGDAELLPRFGCAGVAGPGQAGAELPRAPLTPILYVGGVLGLVMAGEREGPTLQDEQLVSRGHVTVEVCWNMDTCMFSWGWGATDARREPLPTFSPS